MVTIGYAVCFLTILLVKVYGANDKTINEKDADDYLEKFGYLDSLGKAAGGRQRSLAKTRAVKSFQEFAHLPVTGRLDDATKKAMLAPRCGMTDKPKNARAAVARWEKDALTWALVKPTSQLDSGRVRTAIKQALAVWSKIIPLNFTEVQAQAGADMQFGFSVGDHGDGNTFDGQGGVLAHAFFPSHGGLHFDDQEQWAFEDGSKIQQGYTDLLSVTIHELGHSLGLPHSKEEDAIMFPFYRAPKVDAKGNLVQFQLSRFDIQDIQNIYGPREGATTTTPEPTPPGPTSNGAACPRFEAAVTAGDGATYFFTRGSDQGWTKANIHAPPNSGTKFYVSRRFPGAPSNGITAAFTDRNDQRTYLFQGRRVFGYTWKSRTKSFIPEDGFPKVLQNDVPFEPEGALQLKGGHLFLFKGDDFVIWEPASNTVSFQNTLRNYVQNLPANAKASFAVGEDKLYLVNAADYSVYSFDSSSVVSTQPLKSLITC